MDERESFSVWRQTFVNTPYLYKKELPIGKRQKR